MIAVWWIIFNAYLMPLNRTGEVKIYTIDLSNA